jgi:hypothetical protein
MPGSHPSASWPRLLPLVLPLAILSACASLTREDLVFIDVGGDNSCLIEVEGRRFALPGAEDALASHMSDLAARVGGALMGPKPERTTAGCWETAMTLAVEAGFARIGYLTDAPPYGEIG